MKAYYTIKTIENFPVASLITKQQALEYIGKTDFNGQQPKGHKGEKIVHSTKELVIIKH